MPPNDKGSINKSRSTIYTRKPYSREQTMKLTEQIVSPSEGVQFVSRVRGAAVLAVNTQTIDKIIRQAYRVGAAELFLS
jgi:hypothetical protein